MMHFIPGKVEVCTENTFAQKADNKIPLELIHDMNLLLCIDYKSLGQVLLLGRLSRKLPSCCEMRSKLKIIGKKKKR